MLNLNQSRNQNPFPSRNQHPRQSLLWRTRWRKCGLHHQSPTICRQICLPHRPVLRQNDQRLVSVNARIAIVLNEIVVAVVMNGVTAGQPKVVQQKAVVIRVMWNEAAAIDPLQIDPAQIVLVPIVLALTAPTPIEVVVASVAAVAMTGATAKAVHHAVRLRQPAVVLAKELP